MDSFFTIEIQTVAMQVLESSYIIANSKNIETIKSRYEFMLQRLTSLKQGNSNQQYSASVQLATDNYKTVYYNRPLQDYQLAILSDPNTFNLGSFYCNSLVNAMKRFCEEQINEIKEMKTDNAKIKRSKKVLETIMVTKNELQTKSSTASIYSAALTELENLESIFTKTV